MHIDAFESFFDGPQPQTAPAADYAMVPAGRAEVEIIAASIGDVTWKATEANPTGACLKLRLSAGRQFSFVFVDLPKDRPHLFTALAAALGIAPSADGKVSLPRPEELVGRTVAVEIGHYKTKAGAMKATVKRWLPAAVAEPVAKAKPKPGATKPRAAQRPADMTPDDIPF